MNKYILLIALIGASLCAGPDAPSPDCNAETVLVKSVHLGVCQWITIPGCTVLNTDTGACSTCGGTGGGTFASGACPCTDTAKIWQSDNTCVATSSSVVCRPGYGLITYDTSKYSCQPCDKSCKSCNQTITGTDPTAHTKAKCTTTSGCFDSGKAIETNTCPAGTTQTKSLFGVGWFKDCPPGYYDASGECKACLPGCLTCTDAASGCLTCAPGHILNAATPKRCVAAGDTDCDASCVAKNCQTNKDKCSGTACATGYAWKAEQTCVKHLSLCADGKIGADGKCTQCVDKAILKDGACTCQSNYKPNVSTWAKAVAPATTDTPYKNECVACNSEPACADGSTCTASTDATKKDTCTVNKPADEPIVCKDETLKSKANACADCDVDKKQCTKCINTLFDLNADKNACVCKPNTVRKGEEYDCAAIGTFNKDTCKDGKVVGWDATLTPPAVGCIASTATTTSTEASNGLLLSAISMIAALILA